MQFLNGIRDINEVNQKERDQTLKKIGLGKIGIIAALVLTISITALALLGSAFLSATLGIFATVLLRDCFVILTNMENFTKQNVFSQLAYVSTNDQKMSFLEETWIIKPVVQLFKK